MLAVETRQLAKTYRGKIEALAGVDLRVPSGSAFGLLGPNGAGKSTLVKTLLSIVRPTSGAATLFGQDISHPAARRSVGYLPEGHRFPRYLTGRGVLQYFGQLAGLRGEELEKQIEDKLALVGMTDWATTRVTRYSKGMQQRIGLAQAMLGDPRLVFLDEPTDGVDPIGRHQMRELIKEVCERGTTVFLNSHLLLEVEQICDHVAIMHQGRILQQGTLDEVRGAVREEHALLNVRFATGKVGKKARQAVAAIGGVDDADGGIVVGLKKEDDISGVIDVLREHGVKIYAVEPTTMNLEEAFINLIDQQEDQGVGAHREE
jgi:ABC-2 type transport system ATP-binding protein